MPKKITQNEIYTKDDMEDLELPPIPPQISLSNAEYMWENGITGKDVVVAVIDTGCDVNHFLLKDKIIRTVNLTEDGEKDDVTDEFGHGTHVAGIIAADSYNNKVMGIAPNVKLVIYKVVESSGVAPFRSIAYAVNDAAQTNVDIINISLGSPQETEELREAIKYAVGMQKSVVCSAGNTGDGDMDTIELFFPACYEEVISVGATNDKNQCVGFSNSNQFIDCVADGVDILSLHPNDKFRVLTGTSQSAPLVSGALALLKEWSRKEYGRNLSEVELYGNLIKNTVSISGMQRTQQGHGYVYLNPFFS